MRYKGLKKRIIRKKPGSKPPKYITPHKKQKGKSYSQSKGYRYFYSHVIPEIAKQMPKESVICWRNDHMLSIPICIIRKFWKAERDCKRCSLFEDDEYARKLRSLIEEWEIDRPDGGINGN